MAHARMVESYVGQLLSELVDVAERTGDGAFVLASVARPMVDVVPGPADTTLRVRVRAAVAQDAEATQALLEALNEANGWLPYGRLYLDGGTVVVEETIAGAWVEPEPLRNAVRFVDWAVRQLGGELAAAGGGRPAVVEASDDGASGGDNSNGAEPEGKAAAHPAPGRHPASTQVALALGDGPAGADGPAGPAAAGRAAAVNVAGYL
jgi:hypothetical protein